MQQHGTRYVANPPPPYDPGCQKIKIKRFQNMVMLHITKGEHKCSNMVATTLPPDPNPTLGVKMSPCNFSEHGHVAYQIKESHKCSNIVANSMHVEPLDPGGGSQNSNFLEHIHVAYQIKGITNAATW